MDLVFAGLLAAALSIDGFGVGLAYGIKKIKVELLPVFLIAACAAPAMTATVLAGQLAAGFIPGYLAGIISGVILILIGLWQLIEGLKKYKDSPVLLSINLKFFGLVLKVIREPNSADMDKSGEIDFREALLLGIAVNLDAMAAGFGAGIAGYTMLLIPIVATALLLALLLGLLIGRKYAKNYLGKAGYIMPGIILMCLGIVNMVL